MIDDLSPGLAILDEDKAIDIARAWCVAATSRQGFASRFGELEGRRPSGLLLDHRGSRSDPAAGRNIADLQLHQIAAAELGVERAVKQREVANLARRPQLLTDRPDVPWLERRLGADDAACVMGAAGNPPLALQRSIDKGLAPNASGQHVDYLEIYIGDVVQDDMQPVLQKTARRFRDSRL